MKEISPWKLESPVPVTTPIKDLLTAKANLNAISRSPSEIVGIINQTWNLNVPSGKVYDRTPGRYSEYSKMSGDTAKPSVVVDDVVYWGVGRFIAALLRGDEILRVWKIRT